MKEATLVTTGVLLDTAHSERGRLKERRFSPMWRQTVAMWRRENVMRTVSSVSQGSKRSWEKNIVLMRPVPSQSLESLCHHGSQHHRARKMQSLLCFCDGIDGAERKNRSPRLFISATERKGQSACVASVMCSTQGRIRREKAMAS